MKKLNEIKKAIENTPPQRLARIEYQSHFLQMIGVTTACIIILMKGYWYIIFAFIFSLGISLSQGIGAYQKYKQIIKIVGEEKPIEFEKDISFTRRRSKIINYVFGVFAKWFSIIVSVGLTYLFLGDNYNWWILMILYPLLLLIFYTSIYFIGFYKLAYPIYKRRMKKK